MNYKHLRYFWAAAHAGSIRQAAERLHLTPQTLSGQIQLFEQELATALFRPAGRGIELTEAGRVALSYADEIFALGDEMTAALRAHAGRQYAACRVGISEVVPKSLTLRLLSSLKTLSEPVRLICREGPIDWLLGELALHRLDMVLADRPMPSGLSIKAHSHKLGESGVAFLATPDLAAHHKDFPESLNNAPLLLPGPNAAVRGELERWFGEMRLAPQIVGEFDDSALMKVFAQTGAGIFPAPAILVSEIEKRYAVQEIGRIERLREAFWLISPERRVRHPAVRCILELARKELFPETEAH